MTAYQTRFGLPDQRWTFAKNVGSVEIPPHGLVEITTSTSSTAGHVIHSVRRPTTTSKAATLLAVNGPTPIPAGKHGSVTQDYPAFALYNTGDGTPAQGETWGSLINTFTLSKGKAGFTIVGQTLGSGSSARVRVNAAPPNPMECVQVWGTGVSAGVIPSFSGVQAYSGRIRTAALATSYATGDDCYIVLFNSHDAAAGAIVVTEGLFLMGRYIGNHDFGSGTRPVFDARSPIAAIYETGISLNGNWTVTANTATLIPCDEGWPLGYDTNTNLTHANSLPGTDSSKIYLRYSWNTYKVGFTVSFELPATVTGTQFAQNGKFRFFPITVQPYLDGSALTGHEKHGSLWVPPDDTTDDNGDTTTYVVQKVTTDNDFSGQQVTVSGERTIDPGLGFSDNSYVQLKITGAIDAVVRRADLWVRSQFIPPA